MASGGRFSTILKAKINKLLNRMEDPGETLELAYTQQVEMLQQVKRSIAEIVTAKKRLELQQDKLGKSVVKLDQQARQAVAQDNEELARVALERKRFAQVELQTLDGQIVELAGNQESLIRRQEELKSKIEQFRLKKEVVKAQYAAAEAQVNIAGATTGLGGSMDNVALALERANEKVENMRAKAEAVTELEESGAFDDVLSLGGGQDDIDRKLASTAGNTAIDNELASIRADLQLGGSPESPKQLGDGEETTVEGSAKSADEGPDETTDEVVHPPTP